MYLSTFQMNITPLNMCCNASAGNRCFYICTYGFRRMSLSDWATPLSMMCMMSWTSRCLANTQTHLLMKANAVISIWVQDTSSEAIVNWLLSMHINNNTSYNYMSIITWKTKHMFSCQRVRPKQNYHLCYSKIDVKYVLSLSLHVFTVISFSHFSLERVMLWAFHACQTWHVCSHILWEYGQHNSRLDYNGSRKPLITSFHTKHLTIWISQQNTSWHQR